jgi:histidine triad (HIT) family protein
MISADKAAELQVKQLEMVQAIVTRLANYGATLKNYCITLVTAVCGFAITLQRPAVALLSLLPILIFALLDAQFLRVERRFRGLFDRVRQQEWGTLPTFDLSNKSAPHVGYLPALRSWSILLFYVPLLVAVVVGVLIARPIYGWLL